MALFKSNQVEQESSTDHLVSSRDHASSVICKSPGKLNGLLQSIAVGQSTFYLSNGDWSLHDLIIPLVKQYQPVELFITTYAIREFSIRQLLIAIENRWLKAVTMVLDHRASVRTPDVYQLAKHNFSNIYLTAVHAKICVIKHVGGCITVISSSNWTSNPKIETGVVTMDPAVGNFYIENILKISDGAEIFK